MIFMFDGSKVFFYESQEGKILIVTRLTRFEFKSYFETINILIIRLLRWETGHGFKVCIVQTIMLFKEVLASWVLADVSCSF